MHTDRFGNELHVDDEVITSNYCGDLYKGNVVRFTKKFVILKVFSRYDEDLYSFWYKSPDKIYKI